MPTIHCCRPKRNLDTVLINPAKAQHPDRSSPTCQIEQESEKNRHVQSEHPWGASPESLKKLERNEIARVIDAHFGSKGLNVVGEMDVQAFLYGKHRTTRPRHPVHSFTNDPQTDHATSSGGSRPGNDQIMSF